jgi:hypothetical protein
MSHCFCPRRCRTSLVRTISPGLLSLVREAIDLSKITGTYGSERGQPPFDPIGDNPDRLLVRADLLPGAIIGLPPRSRYRTNELRVVYPYGRKRRLTG